jgi:hypothetical protein
MKIKAKVMVPRYESVEVEIYQTAYLPVWARTQEQCDFCHFPFYEHPGDENNYIMIIRTDYGIKHIHPQCINRGDQ